MKTREKKPEFSAEQKEILNINFEKHSIMTIKALAGTGKTTTVIEFAESHRNLQFLYIARNNSIVADVKKTITRRKSNNLKATTMHAFAYQWIVSQRRNITIENLDAERVAAILGVKKSEIKKQKDLQRVVTLFKSFCSQLKPLEEWLQEAYMPLESFWGAEKAKALISNVEKTWKSIDTGAAGFITHDYYLKKFIDAAPPVKQDAIIIDESQDLDEIMFYFIQKQISYGKGIIAVGDQNQSIYGFLKSKDIIKELNQNAKTIQKSLTRSFRFEPHSKMETMANAFLSLKSEKIYGAAVYDNEVIETTGYIARTNLQILQKAISLILENKRFNLVGGMEVFNLSLLLDVWFLSSSASKAKVKSEFLKGFENKRELQEWANEHKDMEILTACNIVDVLKKYAQDTYLKEELNIKENERKNFLLTLFKKIELSIDKRSPIILSTFHRSKGLSIDKVVILSSEKTEKENILPVGFESTNVFYEFEGIKYERVELDKEVEIYDEYNLMYVAVTRAKKEMSVLDKRIIISANFAILINNLEKNTKNAVFYDNILFIKLPYQGASSSFFAIDADELEEFKKRVLERT